MSNSCHQNHQTPTSNKPGPWRITFDTNPDDCNLHCIMCEEHSPYSQLQKKRRELGQPPRRMQFELIEKILSESVGSPLREIIPSTMGEPLLYQEFDRIIDLCQDYGIQLNLTTNGTFPGKGATAWAKKLVPVTSDVKISWNGATKVTQESIMVGTQWSKVLSNVQDFIAVRDEIAAAGGNWCRVTFQLTFLATNVEELPEIIKLAASLGVDRIKGHHLWAHFEEIKPLSMRRSPTAIAQWNQIVKDCETAADSVRKPNGEKIILENIFTLDTEQSSKTFIPLSPPFLRGERGGSPVGSVCPFLGQEAWVSTEGRFNPCCAPDALRRSLGEFGNLHHTSISEIWQSDPYQTLQKHYQNYALCARCNMRKSL